MRSFSFIVNPVSGGKDKTAIVRDIRTRFPDCEILYTERPGQAEQLAASCAGDVVVAVGGDGTVNEVARGLVGGGKALGIVPCGSGDGLALHLGMSRNPRRALEQLQQARTECMDFGTMNGRPFFCTTGVGFDAQVGLEFSKSRRRGLLTYVTTSARNWFGYRPERYELEIDGIPAWEGPAVFVTVGNANQWGNRAKICGGASVLDGWFDITIVKPFSTLLFPVLLLRLMSGKVEGSSKTICLKGKKVVIRRASEGPAHFDGEPVQEGPTLDVELHASALHVLIPNR